MDLTKTQFEDLCKLIMIGNAVMYGDVELKDIDPNTIKAIDTFYNLNEKYQSDYLNNIVEGQWLPSEKLESELEPYLEQIYGDDSV